MPSKGFFGFDFVKEASDEAAATKVGSQSVTCDNSKFVVPRKVSASMVPCTNDVPRTPPSKYAPLPPRKGKFCDPVAQPMPYGVFPSLLPTGPPLSVENTVKTLSQIPFSLNASMVCPMASSRADNMPAKMRRLGSKCI